MPRYGMVIDLKKCVGCMACTIACKVVNGTKPGIFWARVEDQITGKYPSVNRSFLPLHCMHCQDPPCVEVCPTGASYQRDDGIVLIDYDKCMGCRYCVIACPYGARYFNGNTAGYFGAELTPYEETSYQKHSVGVVEKCTFCIDRIEKGKQPLCVETCMGKARYFGDLEDPKSEISQLIRSKHGQQLHPEFDTEPSVYYLR